MRLFQYAILLNFLLVLPASAQNINISASLTKDTIPTASSETHDLSSDLDLRLRLDWRSSLTPYFPDYWNTYANQSRTTTTTIYKGLYGLAHKYILRTINRYYNKELQNLWFHSTLHPLELDRKIRQYSLEASDVNQRWWESREYFFDHYPIDKGGIKHEFNLVGHKIKILELGVLKVYNTGKISISDWSLDISQNKDLIDKRRQKVEETAPPTAHKKTVPITEEVETASKRYSFGIHPPREDFFTSKYWALTGKLRVSINLSKFKKNSSRIRGSLKFRAFTSSHRPWLMVELRTSAKPLKKYYEVELLITLLTF